MKNFLENMSKLDKGTKKLLIWSIIALIAVAIFIYQANDYVIIRFDELGFVAKNMNAYYNGFKIGKIISVEPDTDFKHVLAKLRFFRGDINLPQNTIVRVQSFPSGELYLEFVYPQSPSLKPITRGTVLQGIGRYNLADFMQGQNISGITDVVTLHVIRTLQATEIANHEIKMFFQNASGIVNDNRSGIKASVNNTEKMTSNLAQTAVNLNNLSKKLNNSIDEQALKQTTSNVKETTDNIVKVTSDINTTVQKINDAADEIHTAASHYTSITSGLNDTLSKKMGGMRVLFGSPTKGKGQNAKCKNECK